MVLWDKIVRSKRQAKVHVTHLKNKYGVREVSRTFQNVTAMEFGVSWNVMPYVGMMRHGRTPLTPPLSLSLPAAIDAQKVQLLRY